MGVVKWVDLSSVGVHLGSYRDAKGSSGLAIIDVERSHHEAIVGLGFAPANGALQEGLYLKADYAIMPAALRAAFGEDAVRFIMADRNAINRDFNAKVKEITKINSTALFLQQRPVGMNHLGELVQESVAGRFIIRNVDGKTIVAKEGDAVDRALFLRAATLPDLRKVAAGFVKRIVVRSEQLHREHVKRLMDVSNEGGFSERQYQEAIETGLNELFAEGLKGIIAGEAAGPLAAFDFSNKLYLGMPELKVRTANSVALQQYSSPLPLATVAQALLGAPEAIARSAVLEPTIGNANLVTALNAGLRPEDRCRVYGVELDAARVEHAQDVATSVVLGDASTINFRAQFGRPEGFDFVIANPPFGSLPSKVDLPLPEGSTADSMTTQRLDHLILLRSLHARSDNGRAVYITGADSAVENGDIKGRSKYLLNYLHDHYEIEGLVDVSGELYKKQGAQFPLRLYVIGARKTVPEQTVVPEKLDVIRTYEGLREWAEGVISHQRLRAVEIEEVLQEDPAADEVPAQAVVDPLVLLGGDPDVIRAVVAQEAVLPDVDDGWIVMNAPRPLCGHFAIEDEFRHGRFYAAIDPSDTAVASAYLKQNLRDDARVVFVPQNNTVASLALKLVPQRYRDTYLQMDEAERQQAISIYLSRLDSLTVGQLRSLDLDAVPAELVSEEPEREEEVREKRPELDQELLRALLDMGWENKGDEGRLYWVTRTIGGGYASVVNPAGDRRLSAKLIEGRMLAKHGDGALIDVAYDMAKSAPENAAILDAAVTAIDPRAAAEAESGAAEIAFERAANAVDQPALRAPAAAAVGDRIRFTAHDNGDSLSVGVVEGLVIDVASTSSADWRYRIFTDVASPQGPGNLEKLVYGRGGVIEKLPELAQDAIEVVEATAAEDATDPHYTAFNAKLLRFPTALQLGLDDRKNLSLLEDSPGFTNRFIIDLGGRPPMVEEAIAKYHNSTDMLATVPASALSRVMSSVTGASVMLVPAAFYDDVIEIEGRITGSGVDMRREPAKREAIAAVVLINEQERSAVTVNRRYFGYFTKAYPQAQYMCVPGALADMVLVTVGGEPVGLIKAMGAPELAYEHALAVSVHRELGNEAGINIRDALLAEKSLAAKAQPMQGIDGRPTGWRKLEHANGNGVTLVSADGLQAVDFASKDVRSGTESLRAYALAQSFAMDNPYHPEAFEGPQGELVIEPIGRKVVSAGATQKRERQSFSEAPVENYTLVKTSLNGVKLRPMPGKTFTQADIDALVRWFGENGWSAQLEKNSVRAVGPADARWTDVPKAARLSKRAEKNLDALEKHEAQRVETAQKDSVDLERLESSAWIDKTFGPQAMNDFNKAALARFIAGEAESFEGIATHNWDAGFAAVGIDAGAGKSMELSDALSTLKATYQKSLAEPKLDERQDNEFQQRYIAYSNVSEPDTMIPANLSGPVYEALTSIKEAHGDIDEFVGRELDIPIAQLGKYFKAEQVDALAMIFHANNRNLGFLLADKMGVGKGRVLAGVARRERLKGRIPVFITVTPNLFSDFLERDVDVIGSRELFKKPLIINDGCKTVDQDGNVVARALKRPEFKRYAEDGMLPEGTDMILLTYSQICRQPHKNLTSRYLRSIAAQYPISLLLDESHNGAGASNTSENLEAMIDAIGNRGSVVYSSGTAIKGAKNLRLYKKILPRGIDHEELLNVVESDPLSLQEALNFEIAAQGCLISRELDNAGIEKEYVLSENVERNRRVADQVAKIFTAMCYLSGDVAKIVGDLNREFRKELENIPEEDRAGTRMGASSMNFGSRLHELNRQFLLAIKAPDVVRSAIATLEANKKPIISLQHTGESMLVDFVTRANEVYDNADQKPKLEQRVYTLDRPVTFKDLMRKYLEKITWITEQGRYGDVSQKKVTGEKFENAIEHISALIDELDDDLPITPIDYFREKLAAHGYSVAEISGRNLMARTMDDGRVSIEQVPGRTDKTRVNRAVRDFNNGECDVLILTGSGSTGLSVQANPAVGKDIRARRMIKAEMQPDIARERQMDGRHNRTGQVALPEYEIPLCGLPADDRLSMMFNNKNRSLSSSTVANRDSKDLIRQVPDLLNEVGDMAAEALLFQQPHLAVALDIDLPEDGDDRLSKSGQWFANKLSGRLSLLPVAEQERVYAEWQAKFVEKLDMLKAEGRNPLEVEVMDFKAKVLSREIFMGAAQKADGKESSFNAPIYLTTLEYEKSLKAVRAAEIDRKIETMGNGYRSDEDPNVNRILAYLREHRDSLLGKQLGKKFSCVAEALTAKEPNEVQNLASKLAWLTDNLPKFKAGAVFIDSDLEGKKVPHVIVSHFVPMMTEAYARPSDYTLYMMQPGSDVVEMATLSTLFTRGVTILPIGFDKHDVVRNQFDLAEDGVVVKKARVFDGNLFEATALNLRERVGRKIVYTDRTGARQHGILIYADVSTRKLESLPEKVRDPKLVTAILDSGISATSDPAGNPAEPGFGIVVSRLRTGQYKVMVPASRARGGEVYLDPILSLITGKEAENKFNLNFSTESGKMVGRVEKEHIIEVLAYLVEEKNMNFYFADRTMVRQVRARLEGSHEHCLDV